VITLYPFLHTIAISFSGVSPINKGQVFVLPKEFHITSYTYIIKNKIFWDGAKVTLLITLAGTLYSVIMTCLLAYPLSKRDFRLKTPITMLVVFTMFFGGGLIPEYLLYRTLGLYNTIWVYLIPGAISTWSLLILRNFFMQIPAEIEESAFIDGASELTILFRIIIPISMPSIATITLWYAVGKWNTFDQSLFFTSSKEYRTLQVVLRNIIMDEERIAQRGINDDRLKALTSQSLKAAWIMCTTIPIMIVYPFLQKYFVKGVIVGSLKG
jgi:putative aldouronate transport system permease protein